MEPPGPIPNPEVKRCSANGSETIGLVRVGRRQVYAPHSAMNAGLFFVRVFPHQRCYLSRVDELWILQILQVVSGQGLFSPRE